MRDVVRETGADRVLWNRRYGGPERAVDAGLKDWGLLPTAPDWSAGLARTWTVGERAAHDRLDDFLDDFLDERLPTYTQDRDVPAKPATSGLAPHLRWGEISPHTVWYRALSGAENPGKFLTELGWREYAWYNLYIHPDMATRPINPKFERFPWPPLDDDALAAWQRGRTGIPLVDADPASNPHNWQWAAGSGTDAAPYFRIFNPETQQKKFDPDFVYVDRWNGRQEGVESIVGLKASRAHALELFKTL
ncbi:FAD-binding domain-containing protein [Kocuria marina]|uniref:FAD-binding domain-containing protein n=1 Tax=Kocuria marina TaxID=223184 RepID=UPI002989BE66|nr:FAD-binding domain-containing protein [Kocuria marina]MCT2022057.1 hypothetical protein [Kocuria marina]